MDEEVKALVLKLQDIVRIQTKANYPDVNIAVTSLRDYVQESTATRRGVEGKLKDLEDMLLKKSEKKKPCTEHIEKIRKAMRLQKPAATAAAKPKNERRASSPSTSERASPMPGQTKDNMLRKRHSPAKSQRATPSPSQNKENNKLRSDLTQVEETTELSERIDENDKEYRDGMADEVLFFVECINGLKAVFSDDTINPLEKIIPVPNGKIKKRVETGYTSVMDVARDIRRLKTENQYLRKTLNGLHKYVIGGDETELDDLKAPKHMKDNQSSVELEVNVKEVKKKFHDMKTNAETVTEESKCLFSTMECLINHLRGLSDGNTESDISSALIKSLDQIKLSVKKENPANQIITQAKEIMGIQMEWKREAEYATYLFTELKERLADDGKQDTQVGLKEPPIQMERVSSNEVKKGHSKQNVEKPISRHIEQLRSNFVIMSNVLKKLMNAEESITERDCLFSTLKCLRNCVRDLFEGKTEGETSPSFDKIWSSIKTDSSVNQGLSHAKEILGYQMEWKREVEYVSCLLKELEKVSQSTNNGNNNIILSQPLSFGSSPDNTTHTGTKTESSQNKPIKSVQNEKLTRHYSNASFILKNLKENEDLRIGLGKKTDEVQELMRRLKQLQDENNETHKEANSLRTRLSEHAGALLTYDNPSIADLSDPNRPTKLAEKYSELYDNLWTDAFANIAKEDPDIKEKKIVGYLYELLVDGYHFCEDVRQKQILALEDTMFHPAGAMKASQRRQTEEISVILANQLSDVAKLSSKVSSVNVAKAFAMDENTKDKYSKVLKPCETYIQECVQLCWLMQVQTPPLCLDLKTIQGHKFDKTFYKEYTKTGEKIAFVIWPALFLHDKGPLLSKGVAQCE